MIAKPENGKASAEIPPMNDESKMSTAATDESQSVATHPTATATATSTGTGNPTPSVASIPEDIVTPSHIAKTKWNDVIDNLPSEELASITRTYTNRLHQLRLQREKHLSTHDRHTKGDSPLPSSCAIHFELGATHAAIKERPEYVKLKESVESAIEATQNLLKNAIVELQVIEMQAKEEEIRKLFCEGLAKIAISLINYHRHQDDSDHQHHHKPRIAKTMQTVRLADRLVELLLEQHPHLLEYAYLPELNLYYSQVGRDIPTHSRQQNRNTQSSPYNPHHTQFLQEFLLEPYKNIIEPCFHSSWKEYLTARTKLHQQQSHQKLLLHLHNSSSNSLRHLDASEHNPTTNTTTTTTRRLSSSVRSNSLRNLDGSFHNSRRISFAAEDSNNNNNTNSSSSSKVMTAATLKAMVHDAVSQETKGLKDSILTLQEQFRRVMKQERIVEEEPEDGDREKTKPRPTDSTKKEHWEAVKGKRRGSHRNSHNKEETKKPPTTTTTTSRSNKAAVEHPRAAAAAAAAPEEEDGTEHTDSHDDHELKNGRPLPKRGKRRSRKKGKDHPTAAPAAAPAPSVANGGKNPPALENGKKLIAVEANGIIPSSSDKNQNHENGTTERTSISISESIHSVRDSSQVADSTMDDSTTQMFGDFQSTRRNKAWG